MQTFLITLLCLVLSGFNLNTFNAIKADREALAASIPGTAVKGMLGGSFIQAWLAYAYTEAQWNAEFSKMHDLGMEYLIVETFLDNEPLYDTDPAVDDDMLSMVLRSAAKHDIKIIAGLTNGAGVYYDTAGAYANWLTPWKDPFEAFRASDLAQAGQIMNGILGKYGQYGDTLHGWYFAHEFFNNALYGKAAWQSIGRHLNGYVQAIEASAAPDMPLVFSPFYQIGLPYLRPDAYVCGLETLFAEAKLRPFDVFMPQDGFGTVTGGPLPEEAIVPALLAPWIEALGKAARAANVTFWINNEAFHGPDIATRPPAQVAMQALRTDEYTKTHFIFSWNHYYSATFYPEKAALEQEFADIFTP